MNDVPPPVPHIEYFTPSGGLMSVTLPIDAAASPIVVMPLANQRAVTVLSPEGAELVTLGTSEKAKFEFQPPRWWQFWRRSNWVMTERK